VENRFGLLCGAGTEVCRLAEQLNKKAQRAKSQNLFIKKFLNLVISG